MDNKENTLVEISKKTKFFIGVFGNTELCQIIKFSTGWENFIDIIIISTKEHYTVDSCTMKNKEKICIIWGNTIEDLIKEYDKKYKYYWDNINPKIYMQLRKVKKNKDGNYVFPQKTNKYTLSDRTVLQKVRDYHNSIFSAMKEISTIKDFKIIDKKEEIEFIDRPYNIGKNTTLKSGIESKYYIANNKKSKI